MKESGAVWNMFPIFLASKRGQAAGDLLSLRKGGGRPDRIGQMGMQNKLGQSAGAVPVKTGDVFPEEGSLGFSVTGSVDHGHDLLRIF